MPIKKKEDPVIVEKALKVPQEDVQLVWRAWVDTHGTMLKGRQWVLNQGREQDIRIGIVKYGINDCIGAIKGILYSAWHMGDNPQGKLYNSTEIIFRDGWRVKKFNRLLKESNQSTVVDE